MSLPGRQYDEICALAFERGVSLGEVVREKLCAVERAREESAGRKK